MTEVFISYKREDEAFARRLYIEMQAWGYSPWLDVLHIPPGTSPDTKGWDDAIFAGMKAAEVVVGVMTPSSLASPNVLDEWDYALRNQKRLFVLWLRTVPEADIPPRYGRIQRLDFRDDEAAGLLRLRTALASPVKILIGGSPASTPPEEKGLEGELTASPSSGIALPSPRPAGEGTDRNRERMLRKVHAFWIEGVLEKSLHNTVLLELGMEQKPGAVENPWDSVFQHSDYGDYKLPPGTKIIDVFPAMNGELLILGEPGSGKTTTLLELARDRIAAALQDNTLPIPVVFNLSSWAQERPPLTDWLVAELSARYQVPEKAAKQWVEHDALTLLLDGLDEVKEEYRDPCVDAINAFRSEHVVDLVVCSRIADYNELTSKLRLQGAVSLQALTGEQVDDYLARFGDEMDTTRHILKTDAVLRELAETPLMLSIITFAYRGMPFEEWEAFESVETCRRHVFDAYLQRMFQRRGAEDHYSPEQTVYWLSWLARRMDERDSSVFYIENLQPDWYPLPEAKPKRRPSPRWQVLVDTALLLAFPLTFLVVAAFSFWLDLDTRTRRLLNTPWPEIPVDFLRSHSLLLDLLPVVSVILVVLWVLSIAISSPYVPRGYRLVEFLAERLLVRLETRQSWIANRVKRWASNILDKKYERDEKQDRWRRTSIQVVETLSWSPERLKHSVWQWIRNVLLLGVLILIFLSLSVLIPVVAQRNMADWPPYFLSIPATSLFGVMVLVFLFFAIFFLTIWGTQTGNRGRRTSRLFVAITFVFFCQAITFLIGLLSALSDREEGLQEGLRSITSLLMITNAGSFYSLILILAAYVVAGGLFHLVSGIIKSIVPGQMELRTSPNQGIRWSAYYAILAAGVMLAIAVVPVLIVYLQGNDITLVIVIGILVALWTAWRFGGGAAIRHARLRRRLYRKGYIPWNYARFLDYCAERILLRKVGGGYIFIHRYLLEYFANLEGESS